VRERERWSRKRQAEKDDRGRGRLRKVVDEEDGWDEWRSEKKRIQAGGCSWRSMRATSWQRGKRDAG
jgi:hypothetical protein